MRNKTRAVLGLITTTLALVLWTVSMIIIPFSKDLKAITDIEIVELNDRIENSLHLMNFHETKKITQINPHSHVNVTITVTRVPGGLIYTYIYKEGYAGGMSSVFVPLK